MSNIRFFTNRTLQFFGRFSNPSQDQGTGFKPSVTKGTLSNAPSLPSNSKMPPTRPKSPIPEDKPVVQKQPEMEVEDPSHEEPEDSEVDEETQKLWEDYEEIENYVTLGDIKTTKESDRIEEGMDDEIEEEIEDSGEGIDMEANPIITEHQKIGELNARSLVQRGGGEVEKQPQMEVGRMPPPRPKSPIPEDKPVVQKQPDMEVGDQIGKTGEGIEREANPMITEHEKVNELHPRALVEDGGDEIDEDEDESELTGDTKDIADFFAEVDEFFGIDDEEDDTVFDEALRQDVVIDYDKLDLEALDQVVKTLEQIDAEEQGIDTDFRSEPKPDATSDEIVNVLRQIDAEHGSKFDRPISPFPEDRYDTLAWSRPPEPSAPPLPETLGMEQSTVEEGHPHEPLGRDSFLEDLGTTTPMSRLSLQDFLLTEQGNIDTLPDNKERVKDGALEKFGRLIATKFKAFGNMVKSAANSFKEKMHDLAETRRELKLQREMATGKVGGAKMDRLDERLAGGPPKLSLQTPGALAIFAVKSEVGIRHHPLQRDELLSHISNEMSGFLKEVRAQMTDPLLNKAKLPMSTCIECAVKEMISKASLAELQALNIDTLTELSMAFMFSNQSDKMLFAEVLKSELERFGDLSDGEAVVEKQNKLLDEVAAVRSGGPSKYDTSRTKVSLGDLVDGQPHEISNHLTSLLKAWNEEAASEKTNPYRLSPTEYRQVAILRLFQENEASQVRQLDPQKAAAQMKLFLAEGQMEKAKAMSEILDLIESSATAEGANELFKNLALREMRNVSDIGVFLRNTTIEGTAAVKKLMNANGASKIEGPILKLVQDLNNDSRIQELSQQYEALGKPRFSSPDLPSGIGMEIGALALNLMQAIHESPIPQEITALLGELAGALPENGQKDAFKHKLYTDQLILKLATPVLALKGNSAIFLAADLINVIANGIRPPNGKYGEAGNLVLMEYGKPILELQERMLIKAGMPPSASVKWSTKLG